MEGPTHVPRPQYSIFTTSPLTRTLRTCVYYNKTNFSCQDFWENFLRNFLHFCAFFIFARFFCQIFLNFTPFATSFQTFISRLRALRYPLASPNRGGAGERSETEGVAHFYVRSRCTPLSPSHRSGTFPSKGTARLGAFPRASAFPSPLSEDLADRNSKTARPRICRVALAIRNLRHAAFHLILHAHARAYILYGKSLSNP